MEFGVLLIPLILIAFGITEFGRALFEYNAIVKGTRDGVRFLSMKGPLDPADPASAPNTAQTKCLVVYGNTTCSGQARVPGLTTAMVSVCDSVTCPGTHASQPVGTGVISLVTVTVSGYVFNPAVAFAMTDPITFNDISTTMRQFL